MPSAYQPGTVINAKYRLVRRLGVGGMGEVWVARNLTLHAETAIKVLRRDLAESGEIHERLLDEARAAAQLEHPSIVRVYDFGRAEPGDPFIVMEVLRGSSLGHMLDAQGALCPTYVGQILLPILSALAFAHDKKIVHRDIKPDNIILALEPNGDVVPKLLDFGIAKLPHRTASSSDADASDTRAPRAEIARLTRSGKLVGTPAYMAPEAARGDDIDGRSDIWALGVVFYEAITGTLPFHGDDVEATLVDVLTAEPPSILSQGIDDPELWAILSRALAKDPADRWPDARAFGVALSAWLQARGTDADLSGRALDKVWPNARPATPPRPVTSIHRAIRRLSLVSTGLVTPPRLVAPSAAAPRAARTGFLASSAILLALIGGLAARPHAEATASSDERATDAVVAAAAVDPPPALVVEPPPQITQPRAEAPSIDERGVASAPADAPKRRARSAVPTAGRPLPLPDRPNF